MNSEEMREIYEDADKYMNSAIDRIIDDCEFKKGDIVTFENNTWTVLSVGFSKFNYNYLADLELRKKDGTERKHSRRNRNILTEKMKHI